nr:immunoglobulin heavy chain junction region [Mus musculus]MBK4183694.1 immunoglobulin heavy chain junction region [Mus musculus]
CARERTAQATSWFAYW